MGQDSGADARVGAPLLCSPGCGPVPLSASIHVVGQQRQSIGPESGSCSATDLMAYWLDSKLTTAQWTDRLGLPPSPFPPFTWGEGRGIKKGVTDHCQPCEQKTTHSCTSGGLSCIP